ncbi:MAG: hypothetical protein AMXMBFR66_35950 [Pseudomonadota bacterium]|nr:DUF3306 domain-containing protein [Rubrivivax sp.]
MADDAPFLARWSRRKAAARAGATWPEAPVATTAAAPAAALTQASAGQASAGQASAGQASAGQTSAGQTSAGQTSAGQAAAALAAAAPVDAQAAGTQQASCPEPAAPPPTLADVDALGRDADFARFVVRDVAPEVRNAALKKLFADPHFNVMDGLDTYIDDYGRPDPLPPGMLRRLAQSSLLGLFDGEGPGAIPTDATSAGAAAVAPSVARACGTPCDAPRPGSPAPPHAPLPASPSCHEDAAVQLQPHDAPGRGGPGPDPAAGAGGQR